MPPAPALNPCRNQPTFLQCVVSVEGKSFVEGSYISPGADTVCNDVDFGTSDSEVTVRSAIGGNCGTATFYLDSMENTPIATVDSPVTGGWQTWTNVTALVSGASGVHDLYVVFDRPRRTR